MKRPSLPKALDSKQLQEICMACGLAKSPPKSALHSRIQIAAKEYKPLPPDARILSIDLGIRNMAFCIIRPWKPAPVTTSSDDQEGQPSHPPTDKTTPPFRYPSAHVEVWKRLSLSVRDTDGGNDKDEVLNTNIEAAKEKPEDFSPAYMAQMALHFVQTHILPHKPTHILIERQRFRSSSSPAILDWTIRVNTLEAMIYSILAVYSSNGVWQGEVVPVAPRRVGTFLLEDNQSTAALMSSGLTTPSKILEAATKKRKIELLGRIIQQGDLLYFSDPEAESLGGSIVQHARLESQDGEAKGRYEKLTKADDLADCLLQGLAWLEWQRNTGDLIKNQTWVSNSGEKATAAKSQAETDLQEDAKSKESDGCRKSLSKESRAVWRKKTRPRKWPKWKQVVQNTAETLGKDHGEQPKEGEGEEKDGKQAQKLLEKIKSKKAVVAQSL